MIGRVLDGRYRVGPRIARGGMATVYEATDLRLDRTVAVKVMHAGLGDDDEFAARFVREARAAARLSHPNVVGVFDQGDDDGTLFLAMEYVPGHTLRDLIRKEAPMPPAQGAGALIDPVLSALAAAHQAGLVHRDVKPENVLLADDGRVKVADFGLARAVSAETQHTATGGVLIGTVSYLAPELVVDGRADARSDVYAAGVVLYEMLTGRKPHEGESPIQVAYKHVHEDVPPPSRVVARHPAVRRRAGRPRHRPRPRPAPGRRAGAAAPGPPGPRRPRRRRLRRPGADRRPDPDAPGAAARGRRHDYVDDGREDTACRRSSRRARSAHRAAPHRRHQRHRRHGRRPLPARPAAAPRPVPAAPPVPARARAAGLRAAARRGRRRRRLVVRRRSLRQHPRRHRHDRRPAPGQGRGGRAALPGRWPRVLRDRRARLRGQHRPRAAARTSSATARSTAVAVPRPGAARGADPARAWASTRRRTHCRQRG